MKIKFFIHLYKQDGCSQTIQNIKILDANFRFFPVDNFDSGEDDNSEKLNNANEFRQEGAKWMRSQPQGNQIRLSDKIQHINASPEFLSNSENVEMINKMVDKASKMVVKNPSNDIDWEQKMNELLNDLFCKGQRIPLVNSNSIADFVSDWFKANIGGKNE